MVIKHNSSKKIRKKIERKKNNDIVSKKLKNGGQIKSTAKGARTTIPGSDGGKGEERWWRFTVGRCTTEGDWGDSISIHWANYLRERVRGISQHPFALSAFSGDTC